jgi:hypothetical protein
MENNRLKTRPKSDKQGTTTTLKTVCFKEVAFVIFYDIMDYSILKYFNFKDYTKYTLQKLLKL